MDALSPLDAAFLEAEDADAHTSMAIASVGLFDGAPPPEHELLCALSSRLPLLPRYHQRVHRAPFDVSAPVWIEDPDFDIAYHVRRTALPAPGGEAELHRLLSRVMAQRLDRDRPLWEMWVVEGLATGQWALISKVHHCMVDGVAGTELYHLLLSSSPDVEDLSTAEFFEPLATPSRINVAAETVRRVAAQPWADLAGIVASWRHPRRLLDNVVTTGRGAAALLLAGIPGQRTSLVGPIGKGRRYAAATVSLGEAKDVRAHFGVTINDVALAAVTAGFRALLQARGEPCTRSAVRSLVPVNVRVPGTEGQLANRVSCLLVDLPVQLADPVARLEAVHQLVLEAKGAKEAEAGEILVALTSAAPFGPVAAGLRTAFRLPQRSIVTVTTNVPGPREPLYLLGRRMTRLLPYVPIADQVRLGVAILSYCDELTFGCTGDYDSAPDLDVLLHAVRQDLEALVRRSRQ